MKTLVIKILKQDKHPSNEAEPSPEQIEFMSKIHKFQATYLKRLNQMSIEFPELRETIKYAIEHRRYPISTLYMNLMHDFVRDIFGSQKRIQKIDYCDIVENYYVLALIMAYNYYDKHGGSIQDLSQDAIYSLYGSIKKTLDMDIKSMTEQEFEYRLYLNLVTGILSGLNPCDDPTKYINEEKSEEAQIIKYLKSIPPIKGINVYDLIADWSGMYGQRLNIEDLSKRYNKPIEEIRDIIDTVCILLSNYK